ncbi:MULTISPECIES: PGPGW domain-containing protein [unclassified Blastococcus]
MTRSTDTRAVTFRGNTAAGPGQPHDGAPGATVCPDCTDGLGKPRPIEPGSFRDRLRHNKPVYLAWRVGVFVVGLLFVLLGVALTALPGPLTIPPVLLGLWVWSTEFDWARRFFAAFRRKASATWRHARQHPVSSAAVTVGGLVLAGVAFWAVGHFQLVDRATTALGIG